MATPPHVVRVYPGETSIMFNMVQCNRMKKRDPTERSCTWVVRDHKSNDDEKTSLIIRLNYSKNSPWIVGHYGAREILRSPLCVPILKQQLEDSTVDIHLRDHAETKDQGTCIRRIFKLHFPTHLEASIFRDAHNKFLFKHFNEFKGSVKVDPQTTKVKVSKTTKRKVSEFDPLALDEASLRLTKKKWFQSPTPPPKESLEYKTPEKEIDVEGGVNSLFSMFLANYNRGDTISSLDDGFEDTQQEVYV